MTGILDHTFFSGKEKDFEKLSDSFPGMKLPEALNALKQVAIDTNKEWAKVLGIDQSTAITCVKPSGTVSQLVNAASGIHPRYAHYYIRRIRADKKDPVSKLMRDAGVPVEDDITSPQQTDVFSFPMEAPDTAILRDDMTALDQLKLTMIYQKHWCEHKPSITIYVREPEWMEVGAYVYKNFDDMCGIAFLPYDSGSYRQAPYEEIDRENYEKALVAMPINIDWSLITKYETEDQTTNSKELACSSGHCEI
jgi:ribonucleoside-diphosphate reductase alpha chain